MGSPASPDVEVQGDTATNPPSERGISEDVLDCSKSQRVPVVEWRWTLCHRGCIQGKPFLRDLRTQLSATRSLARSKTGAALPVEGMHLVSHRGELHDSKGYESSPRWQPIDAGRRTNYF